MTRSVTLPVFFSRYLGFILFFFLQSRSVILIQLSAKVCIPSGMSARLVRRQTCVVLGCYITTGQIVFIVYSKFFVLNVNNNVNIL